MQLPERKYRYRPDNSVGPVAMAIWEIRHQLEINIEQMICVTPVDEDTMKLFGHPIEMATSHVFDLLNELEALLEKEGVFPRKITDEELAEASAQVAAFSAAFDKLNNGVN